MYGAGISFFDIFSQKAVEKVKDLYGKNEQVDAKLNY